MKSVMRCNVRRSMCRALGLVLCVSVWLSVGTSSAEEWELDADRIYDVGIQIFEEYAPAEWRGQVELPGPDEWRTFWREMERALQSYELIDLAWIRPEAETALSFLQVLPVTEPYASWLLQRMDYLDMAHQVLRSHMDKPDPIRPPPPPREERSLKPPAPRSPVRVSPEENRHMQSAARSEVNWNRKLAGRAAPARAAALVPGLKAIFDDEGVPPELIWLAEVESSFNPSARSPVGATGLFQFMPATAERFGMNVAPQDDRLDPHKSARAAAQYLRFLHGRFESWPLALAAYNAGEGRVGRLLRTHDGVSFEDIVAYLPSETQMYVPKVMATVALREGIDPATLPPPVRRLALRGE